MYIYYITRYYTKISLFTLQYFTILLYNTIQCTVRIQNTLFIPGCSCCSCLLLSIWLTTVQIKFWVVSRKKNNKDCHFGQSLCTTVCRFGGDCKEFNFTFTFKIQLANERLDKWHFIQEGDGKYLDLQRKNLLSSPGKQIFCLFWIECNIFPTIAQSKYNIFYLEI